MWRAFPVFIAHGATPSGGERIAARWADHRSVTQIPFQPDWTRHKKAAPFKRNDEMLAILPKGMTLADASALNTPAAAGGR